MKRNDLIKEIREAADAKGIAWRLDRSTGKHDVWLLGDRVTVPVPRHKDIGPKMAFEIRKQCEPELGPRWWR